LGLGLELQLSNAPSGVLDIDAKYYNKWYMSIEPKKKFRNEKKPFKVMARMLKVNAMKSILILICMMALSRRKTL